MMECSEGANIPFLPISMCRTCRIVANAEREGKRYLYGLINAADESDLVSRGEDAE